MGGGVHSISVLCVIFPSSHLYFGRSLSKNDLPQEIREVCRHKCVVVVLLSKLVSMYSSNVLFFLQFEGKQSVSM